VIPSIAGGSRHSPRAQGAQQACATARIAPPRAGELARRAEECCRTVLQKQRALGRESGGAMVAVGAVR